MAAHTDDDPGESARHDSGDAAQVREADNNETDAQIDAMDSGEALLDADGLGEPDDHNTQTTVLTRKRTTQAQTTTFLAAIERGVGTREAASQAGIHLRTAYDVLSRYDVDLGALQAATQKILAVAALDRVEDWRIASQVGAAKRGNHLPAKDWLLHAGIIEPLQGEHQAGIRIAINIGTEDRPMKIVSPLAQNEEE